MLNSDRIQRSLKITGDLRSHLERLQKDSDPAEIDLKVLKNLSIELYSELSLLEKDPKEKPAPETKQKPSGETTSPGKEQSTGDTGKPAPSGKPNKSNKEPEEKTQQKTEEKHPLHEELDPPQTSLNERLTSQEQSEALADRMQRTPINDLKSAISINDRIAFIKELFDGNTREYKKAIDHINKFKNFAEVKFYINTKLRNKYNWEKDNPTVENFMELVYRKFM